MYTRSFIISITCSPCLISYISKMLIQFKINVNDIIDADSSFIEVVYVKVNFRISAFVMFIKFMSFTF